MRESEERREREREEGARTVSVEHEKTVGNEERYGNESEPESDFRSPPTVKEKKRVSFRAPSRLRAGEEKSAYPF